MGLHVHPHMFRHGHVYALVEAGESLYVVAMLLGPASLEQLRQARKQIALQEVKLFRASADCIK